MKAKEFLIETKNWFDELEDNNLKDIESDILNSPDTKKYFGHKGWNSFDDNEIKDHIQRKLTPSNKPENWKYIIRDVPSIWTDDPHKTTRDGHLIGELFDTSLVFDIKGNDISNNTQYSQYISVFPDLYKRIHKIVLDDIKQLSKNINKLRGAYYIRFGKWPRSEQSKNHHTGELENGISAYYAIWNLDKSKWEIEENEENDSTYSSLLTSSRDIYLIQGKRVGYGSDDEPLLKNIKIIKKLYPNEILKNEEYL